MVGELSYALVADQTLTKLWEDGVSLAFELLQDIKDIGVIIALGERGDTVLIGGDRAGKGEQAERQSEEEEGHDFGELHAGDM
jgi:hypothetical protein